MNFFYLFKTMPLPVVAILLPLAAAAVFGAILLYNRFVSRLTGRMLRLSRLWYKLPFLLVLLIEAAVSFIVWSETGASERHVYALANSGWTAVLQGGAAEQLLAALKVDSFGAVSAALMSFIALTAGLRALSDKRNVITPRKIVFFLLACAGIQGIFYSSSLTLLALFLLLTQLGVTGLYSDYAVKKKESGGFPCYYISRVLLLLMFAAGVAILKVEFGTDNIGALASLLTDSSASLWAFILMIVPLLYIFVKPSPYMSDASKICFFGIRTQASLFAAFRVIFSLYGPMQGLQKVPYLFIMLGFASIFIAVCCSCGVRDPERFLDSMMMYIKGVVLVSIGIAMNGSFTAERAALYGVSALESMISLWLIFLPVSATLSIITVFLKQEHEGMELWQCGELADRAPISSFALLFVVMVLAGLPPLIGYSAKQLLFRSASFISPFIMIFLFLSTLLMLLTGLRFIIRLAERGSSRKMEYNFSGESTVAFPLILLLAFFVATASAPGALFERAVAPAANSLINRIIPSDSGGGEVGN
ncbi:MAG: hypothetical protein Q4D58_11095 [Synergistaceae bacterium]|nr:hypothetical protein [Synergistaceae bacterium]